MLLANSTVINDQEQLADLHYVAFFGAELRNYAAGGRRHNDDGLAGLDLSDGLIFCNRVPDGY
nr:hypothetical protein [Arthrobacter sp. V1I7]